MMVSGRQVCQQSRQGARKCQQIVCLQLSRDNQAKSIQQRSRWKNFTLWGLWTPLKTIAKFIPLGISRTKLNLSFRVQPASNTWEIYISFLSDSWLTGTEYILCLQKCPSQTDRENYCLLCNGNKKTAPFCYRWEKKKPIISWEKHKESKSFGILIIHLTVSQILGLAWNCTRV